MKGSDFLTGLLFASVGILLLFLFPVYKDIQHVNVLLVLFLGICMVLGNGIMIFNIIKKDKKTEVY